MKEIKHCSISSIAFIMEIDAYETLYNYLSALKRRYAKDSDGEEIIADIEARIAELILAIHSADRVVSKPLIDNIIKQMGSVDDIVDPDPKEPNEPDEPKEPQPVKRLYRNVDDQAIGGVCAGIAAYTGCSVTLVRVIALLLLFFYGSSLLFYIILWIAMPAALSARQKLEMRGEPITAKSINDYYNSLLDKDAQSFGGSIIRFIGRALGFILRLLLVALMVGTVLAIVASVFGVIFSLCFAGSILGMGLGAAGVLGVVAMFLSIITFGGTMLYICSQLLNSRDIKIGRVIIAFVVWLLLMIGVSVCAVSVIPAYQEAIGSETLDERIEHKFKRFLLENEDANIRIEINRNSSEDIFQQQDSI